MTFRITLDALRFKTLIFRNSTQYSMIPLHEKKSYSFECNIENSLIKINLIKQLDKRF